ncbi:MAG: glycosyltransferase family 2 protein [Deltaproteobacteria bacterium]|nr:glycosyltransferase family 2 protein [Deltaproteobacteria bacterium]
MNSVNSRDVIEDLTVVIPTLGRPILEESLRAIEAGSKWPACIVVVDQGQRPEVARWLAELSERGIRTLYVASSQRGRALGVNRGLERVRTRFVAITDDDCLADPEWLARMIEILRANPECALSGRVEAGGDEQVAFVVTAEGASVTTRPSLKFDPLSGGNMATSMAIFERVGLLDEDPVVRCAEDGEWAYRALRAGVPLRYAPDVSVSHVGWRDSTEQIDQYRTYARSQGGFYGKYLARGDGFIALRLLAHQLRALRRWLRGALKRDAKLTMIGRAYATGLLPGVWAGLRSRAPAAPRLIQRQ